MNNECYSVPRCWSLVHALCHELLETFELNTSLMFLAPPVQCWKVTDYSYFMTATMKCRLQWLQNAACM